MGWEVIEERQSKNKISNHGQTYRQWLVALSEFYDVSDQEKMQDLRCSIEEAAHVAVVAQMGILVSESGQRFHGIRSGQIF